MNLPKDKNGVSIQIGDLVQIDETCFIPEYVWACVSVRRIYEVKWGNYNCDNENCQPCLCGDEGHFGVFLYQVSPAVEEEQLHNEFAFPCDKLQKSKFTLNCHDHIIVVTKNADGEYKPIQEVEAENEKGATR